MEIVAPVLLLLRGRLRVMLMVRPQEHTGIGLSTIRAPIASAIPYAELVLLIPGCLVRLQFPEFGRRHLFVFFMIDVTKNFNLYLDLLKDSWKAMGYSLGESFDEVVLEAEECWAVAASYLFSLIVEGQPNVHAKSLRSPLKQIYPYEKESAFVRLLIRGRIEGVLVQGSQRGQWKKAYLKPGEVLGYIDIFDFEINLEREFRYIKVFQHDERRTYLIPRNSEIRVMRTQESGPDVE